MWLHTTTPKARSIRTLRMPLVVAWESTERILNLIFWRATLRLQLFPIKPGDRAPTTHCSATGRRGRQFPACLLPDGARCSVLRLAPTAGLELTDGRLSKPAGR